MVRRVYNFPFFCQILIFSPITLSQNPISASKIATPANKYQSEHDSAQDIIYKNRNRGAQAVKPLIKCEK